MLLYYIGKMGGSLYELHLGTRIHRYRCSLPGLAGFAVYRREGTHTNYHRLTDLDVKQPTSL